MEIKGLQRTTLIDYPGRIACTLFLFGCNFRCGFCHNPELVVSENGKNFSEEDVLTFLKGKKDYLDGICITGGEPLLTLKKEFVEKIKELGYKVKIDTNGSFPEKLKEFSDEGLVDFISMDIKASKENYRKVVDVDMDIRKIEESIKMISSFPEHEFRTTIIKDLHDKEEIKKISEWMEEIIGHKPKKIYLQAFKNSGKILSKAFEEEKDIQEEELLKLKDSVKDFFEEIEIRA